MFSYVSSMGTKCLRQSTYKRKDLFGLTGSQVSVDGCLTSIVWAYGRAVCHGERECVVEEVFVASRKEREGVVCGLGVLRGSSRTCFQQLHSLPLGLTSGRLCHL